jgi:hypothetical protein
MRCTELHAYGRIAMSAAEKAKLEAELTQAFVEAIETVGLAAFKATSMFASNERTSFKQAA